MGIRLALGADRVGVLTAILRQSLALTCLGIVIGLGAAAASTRYLEALLWGLTPLDPLTFAGVPLLFAVVAALAAFIPARRATRVDPLVGAEARLMGDFSTRCVWGSSGWIRFRAASRSANRNTLQLDSRRARPQHVRLCGIDRAMDLRLLGVGHRQTPFSQIQIRLFRWQMLGFAVSMISGAALVYALPMRYFGSVFFWMKMAAMGLAFLNAFAFHSITQSCAGGLGRRTENRQFGARLAGALGVVLWATVILEGPTYSLQSDLVCAGLMPSS